MLEDTLFYLMKNFVLFSLLLLVSPEIKNNIFKKLMNLARLLYSFNKYLSTPFFVLDVVLSAEYNSYRRR